MDHKKPNICILSECAWPDIGGGVTQAHGLAKFLKENGYNVFFLTQTKGLRLPKEDIKDSIPIYRVFSMGFRCGKYIMLLPALLYLIRNRKSYDIIYVGGFRIMGVLGVAAARMFNKKCILKAESIGEYSGEIFKWGSAFLQKGFFSRCSDIIFKIRNRILNKADMFVAINKIIEEEFYSHGVLREKIRYIPNGVERKIFHPVDAGQKDILRKKLDLPLDKKIVVYTGRLNKGKGLEMLMEVWHRLLNTEKDIFLVVAGSGSNQFLSIEGELKRYVRNENMSNSVVFTGYIHNIDEYLKASDIFVLPSELEGLSCSILEALACGVHVVATDVGGARELISHGKNGLLIPSQVPDKLYEAIKELVSGRIKIKADLPDIFYMNSVLNEYNKLIQSLY